MRFQNMFGTSALFCMVFDAMMATCTPSFQLLNWLNSNKVWCEINHAIIDPLNRHYSRIAMETVNHSTSAIFHELFVCIKRKTSQTVQSNYTNSIYSFPSKVVWEIQCCESVVKEHFIILWPGRTSHGFATTCTHFYKWPSFPSSSSAEFSHHKRKCNT